MRIGAQRAEQADRRVVARRVGFGDLDGLAGHVAEGRHHLFTALPGVVAVLVAEEPVRDGNLVVHEGADRFAALDVFTIGLEARDVPLDVGNREDQRAHAAIGRVKLGAVAGHRHPHRRVRVLPWLGQHIALRHRMERALVTVAFVEPHLRDDAAILVPAALGVVDAGVEAAQLVPGRRAAGAELDAPARQDVEECGLLGEADRVVQFRHAGRDTEAETDLLRLARDRGEEHVGTARVAVFLEEVMLDAPDAGKAQFIG